MSQDTYSSVGKFSRGPVTAVILIGQMCIFKKKNNKNKNAEAYSSMKKGTPPEGRSHCWPPVSV